MPVAPGLESAEKLQRILESDEPERAFSLLGSKMTRAQQLYLLQATMFYRSRMRQLFAIMRMEEDKVKDPRYGGIWYECEICDIRWLDPFDPPPEENNICSHSRPT